MRDLGERVGLHASSIYQYFPSKHDIYDALFELGHHQLHAAMADLDREGDPEVVFRAGSAMFTAFCTEDPVRYQLLFQRTIPDFEPSAASMALAWESYQDMASALAASGLWRGRTSTSGPRCRSASRTSRSPTTPAGSDGHRSSTDPSTCSSRSSERAHPGGRHDHVR